MKLHQLLKLKTKSKRRIGRGVGSGLGKTAGRGHKGQKARGKIPLGFSGSLPFYKKLPKRSGLGNPKITPKPVAINLSSLNVLPAGSIVDLEQLLRNKIVKFTQAKRGVKILGTGSLEKVLTVRLPVSESVRKKIEAKGGKVDYV